MAAQKPSVVVTRRLPAPVETRLKELFDVELRESDTKMTREELIAAMERADVLVPCITDQIDAAMLARAPLDLRVNPLKATRDQLAAATAPSADS